VCILGELVGLDKDSTKTVNLLKRRPPAPPPPAAREWGPQTAAASPSSGRGVEGFKDDTSCFDDWPWRKQSRTMRLGQCCRCHIRTPSVIVINLVSGQARSEWGHVVSVSPLRFPAEASAVGPSTGIGDTTSSSSTKIEHL
jgi:hypothetical protein